jgi:hypothetical protein
VADLHGDLPNALRSLQLGGVADGSGHWVGGTSHLVQTGDLVDRGPSSLPVLQLLWRLRCCGSGRLFRCGLVGCRSCGYRTRAD